MKLRLPLALAGALLMSYSIAYSESVDLNGENSDTNISLSTGDYLTNSAGSKDTYDDSNWTDQTGTLHIDGDVSVGGVCGINLKGKLTGTGIITQKESSFISIQLATDSTFKGTLKSIGATIFLKSDFGTGNTIIVGEKSEFTPFSNGVILTSDLVFEGNNAIYHRKDGGSTSAIFKGMTTFNGNTSFSSQHARNLVFEGGLKGTGVFEVRSAIYGAWNSVELKGANTFSGIFRIKTVRSPEGYKDAINAKAFVKNDKALEFASVELEGTETYGNARLELETNNAIIKKIQGNEYAELFSATAGRKITISEGGSFFGTISEGLEVETNGNLVLGISGAGHDIKSVLSGTGGITVSSGQRLNLSKANTYTGKTILGVGSTLNLTAGGAISSSSALEMNSAHLIMSSEGTQVFNGMRLVDSTVSSITISGAGSTLTVGEITGTGSLLINGGSSITGSLATNQLYRITYKDGAAYYNASYANGVISKGSAFEMLAANSKDPNMSYSFNNTADLTMDNASGLYTIGNLGISGTGKTITLGAGGLKIQGSLTYDNTTSQVTTIAGGDLQVGSIMKTGAGDLKINSKASIDSLNMAGSVTFTKDGSSVKNGLTGSGAIKVEGTKTTLSLSGKMNGFNGTAFIGDGNTLQLNASEAGTFTNITGTGLFKMTGGFAKIVGDVCWTATEEEAVDPAKFKGPSFNITGDSRLEINLNSTKASTANANLPYAPFAITGLTGNGTLVIKTSGTTSGNGLDAMGAYVYMGDAGFNGNIIVEKGALSFRYGDLSTKATQATIVLDGGGLSQGTTHASSSTNVTSTLASSIKIGENGGFIRLFTFNTLELSGNWSGTGAVRRADQGTLNITGEDMSAFSGDFIAGNDGGSSNFTGKKVAMGVLTMNTGGTVNLKGTVSTSLGGIIYTKGTLNLETPELTIGAGGISTTTVAYTLGVKTNKYFASADWTLQDKITLEQRSDYFTLDTQGHNVTFDGKLTFSGAKQGVVKDGAGSLTLKQDNLNLSSGLTINGGTVRYEGSNFQSSGISFANGSILEFSKNQKLTQGISGNGSIVLDSGVNLTVEGKIFNGGLGLTLKGNNKIDFSDDASLDGLNVSSTGNSLRFAGTGEQTVIVNELLRSQDSVFVIDNYNYTDANYIQVISYGTTAWEEIAGLKLKDSNGNEVAAMFDTRGHLVVYQKDVVQNNLVGSGTLDGNGYNYAKNNSYWGALKGKTVNFSEEFTFESGAYTYGFTTQDDITGIEAGNFTVSAKMSDAADGQRFVSIIGQEKASDRTVTFTNVDNSFTGNVTVSQAVLKVAADRPEGIVGGNPTLLGTGNTVNLLQGATLDLATGAGNYTYSNNFTLNGANSLLKQTNGTHTLGGIISISGNDDGYRTLENTLVSGDLTLTGTLRATGNNNTLVLSTHGEDTSRIILNTMGDIILNRLELKGHVEQNRHTLSAVGGIVMGSNSSYLLKSGALVIGGSLTKSGAGEKIMTFGRGTSLVAAGERLDIDSGIRFDFAEEQSLFTLDTGNAQVNFGATLGENSNGSTFTKKGQGVLEFGSSMNTKAALTVDQGTLALKEGVQFSTDGFVTFKQGTTLNLGKGSTLNVTSKIFTFNGSLTGSGNLTGVSKLNFQSGTQYAADMSGQSWDVTFQSGSKMSGSLLKHAGNVTFEAGSHIMFDTSLPVSDDSIGISTTGNKTVRFNGATVGASTSSDEIAWDSTQSYVFTLVSSTNELLGKDGNALSSGRLDDSVSVGGDGWGAFLQGQLSVSETGKELLATVTRNGASLSSYAQTANQKSVAGAIDYAMSNYSTLGLRGSEIDNIIQYFNKMGKSIGEQAPEMLGMVGGLSNYQALAGQRTDLMRHVEAVRQRANAGKGMAGISSVPDNAFWAEGTQSYSRIDGTDNSSPGYTTQSWGSAIGVDFLAAENYSLGVAFAYSNVKMDSNQYASQVKSDNYYVDLYGRWESGNWNGLAVLSGGTASLDTKRSLVMGEESLQGKGSTDGTQFTIMAEVAYNWQWEEDSPTLQPYFGMTVGSSELDGYTESGLDNAGLIIGKQDLMVAQASLGVRLFKQNIDKEMQYETSRWELRAGLAEEFGDTDFVTNSRFIGLTDYGMSTTSEDIGKTALQIGGGFSAAIDQAWSVFADVNGEFRAGQTSMNSTLGLRCTF